jgi:hypothetical protein
VVQQKRFEDVHGVDPQPTGIGGLPPPSLTPLLLPLAPLLPLEPVLPPLLLDTPLLPLPLPPLPPFELLPPLPLDAPPLDEPPPESAPPGEPGSPGLLPLHAAMTATPTETAKPSLALRIKAPPSGQTAGNLTQRQLGARLREV